VPVSDPGSPAPPCPCASRPLPSETADEEPIPAPPPAWEAEPPLDDGKEIDSAVTGEVADAAASAADGAGADAAAVAACRADAAAPVASEPSASARLIEALPASELPAGGAVPALAALTAGGVCAAEVEDLCESPRPPPEGTEDVLVGAAPLTTVVGSEFVSAPAVRTGAASDSGFAAAAAVVAAGEALLDCGASDAADAGGELAGAASESVEPRSVIAGPKTAAPCASCVLAPRAPLSAPAAAVPALDVSVLGVPATGEELAAATPAMAGVASSEPASSPPSKIEGRTGAPLAGAGSCEAAPLGAGTGVAAAGGAPLPEGGNGSPLGLPLVDLAEPSFLPPLAEARSSARAKSRALVALGEGFAAPAALCAVA